MCLGLTGGGLKLEIQKKSQNLNVSITTLTATTTSKLPSAALLEKIGMKITSSRALIIKQWMYSEHQREKIFNLSTEKDHKTSNSFEVTS